jgi:hypothetical protein
MNDLMFSRAHTSQCAANGVQLTWKGSGHGPKTWKEDLAILLVYGSGSLAFTSVKLG